MAVTDTLLITGGAGFVGSYLALALKRARPTARVIAFDNLKRRGSELALTRLAAGGVEFVHGDVRNPSDLHTFGHIDIVIDCAAEPSVHAGYGGSPAYVTETNLVGTLNALELARRDRAAVIFLSTSRVYPMAPLRQLPLVEGATRLEWQRDAVYQGASAAGIDEQFPMSGPRSLYGASKFAAELLIAEYSQMYEIPAVINRCGVLAGSWQMGKVDQGFVSLWVARHFFGGRLSYIGYGGSGKQVRDILHVDDLYRLVASQIDAPERFTGKTYNVGGGAARSVSLLELTGLCQAVTGRAIPIVSDPDTRAADVPWYISDCRALHAETGWAPEKSAVDIVRDVYDWIRRHESTLKPVLCPDG